MSSKMKKNRVSISGQITEICLHGIIIYLSIKLPLFCSLFKIIKIASFLGIQDLLKGDSTLISNVSQRKSRHAEFEGYSFFQQATEYPMTHEQ